MNRKKKKITLTTKEEIIVFLYLNSIASNYLHIEGHYYPPSLGSFEETHTFLDQIQILNRIFFFKYCTRETTKIHEVYE